jgi:hypothetical protein
MLFSPLALPDIHVAVEEKAKERQVRVALKGVALFDRRRRTTAYKAADSGYFPATVVYDLASVRSATMPSCSPHT